MIFRHYLALFMLLNTVLGVSSTASYLNDSLRQIWRNQEVSDSLRFRALEEYINRNKASLLDSVNFYLEEYHALAIEKEDERRVFRALNEKANVLRLQGSYQQAMEFYLRAEDQAKVMNETRLIAIVRGNVGNVHFYQRNYSKSIKSYTDALSVFREVGDDEGIARMLLSIGNVNFDILNYDIALDYYKRSQERYEMLGTKNAQSGIGILYMNMGLIQYEKEAYEDSKISFDDALKILEPLDMTFFSMGCYIYLARNYLELDSLSNALKYANKGLELAKELNVRESIIQSELLLALIESKADPKNALKMGESILSTLPEETDDKLKSEIFQFLYHTYRSFGYWEKSLVMHERFLKSSERLNERKSSYAVAREAVKNEYELMLREKELANEREQAELRFRQFKRTAGLIGVSVLLISGLLLAIYIGNKKSRVKRDLLLAEIEQLKSEGQKELIAAPKKFELSRARLESHIGKELNDTDWKVLQVLFDDPMIMNKEIAEQVFLSVEGIGSALRRMYELFNIQGTKYKKMALLREVIKLSNG